ncbi:MAG: hypothetical protein ACRCWG_00635 [Sarcina sp.]
MTKYTIPFFYTFYTRIKGNAKRVAYLFTFIIPIFIYGITVGIHQKIDLSGIIWTIIGSVITLIGTMSVYEIGYIRNDVFTIKKEKNPTLRLKKTELLYVEKNIKTVVIIKYLIAVASVIILFLIGYKIALYVIGLLLIEIFYFIHNKIRGKLSILSFFILSTLRYVVPLTILNINIGITLLVFILVISIPRATEKASEKKFNIRFLSFITYGINLNYIRAIYYLALTVIIFAQYITFRIPIMYVVLSLYYLFYRGGIAAKMLVDYKKKTK